MEGEAKGDGQEMSEGNASSLVCVKCGDGEPGLAEVRRERDSARADRAHLRAALSTLTDRTEGSRVLTEDERNEYRKLIDAMKPGAQHRDEKPAPELAAYEADIASLTDQRNRVSETADQLRAIVAEILDAFGPSGSGHTARVGQVQIARWRTRAGLTP